MGYNLVLVVYGAFLECRKSKYSFVGSLRLMKLGNRLGRLQDGA